MHDCLPAIYSAVTGIPEKYKRICPQLRRFAFLYLEPDFLR